VQLRCVRQGESLRIDVIDTGIGIPPDKLEHIYDEFYQIAEVNGAERDGYGLGLSIVRHIVKLLDLQIAVVSQSGKGSTFSITLPGGAQSGIAPRAARTPEVRPAGNSDRKRHLLLVEDDPSVRNATRMLLTVAGYRVTTASTIGEAGGHARRLADIDLVVSDYHLDDGETGINAIALVRSFLGPQLKAILVTGDTSAGMRELQSEGSLQIASKPIDADQLLGMIARMLESR
jgi:CheY-like chemotaxis protein